MTGTGHSILPGDITWATSDPSVATVSPTGLVTTLAAGPVTVYATIDALADSAQLLVFDPFSVLELTAGGGFTCAIAAGGSGYCWGNNFLGRWGTGSSMDRSVVPR